MKLPFININRPSHPILNWLNAFLPPVIWAMCIYAFSAQSVLPSLETSTLDFVFKKAAHMMVYAVLYVLLVRGFQLTLKPKTAQRYWWLPLVVCLVYAITDEVHQAITGGQRTPSARDVGYDMLGALLVWIKQYKYV